MDFQWSHIYNLIQTCNLQAGRSFNTQEMKSTQPKAAEWNTGNPSCFSMPQQYGGHGGRLHVSDIFYLQFPYSLKLSGSWKHSKYFSFEFHFCLYGRKKENTQLQVMLNIWRDSANQEQDISNLGHFTEILQCHSAKFLLSQTELPLANLLCWHRFWEKPQEIL